MTKRQTKPSPDAAPGPTPEEAPVPEAVTAESLYADVLHITRTLGPFTDGDSIWSAEEASKRLAEKFAAGYDLVDVETMGTWPQGGVYILWLLGKRVEGPRQVSEIHHVVRTISGMGQGGSLTGFQADAYLTGYLQDGWRLFKDRVIPLGLSPAGVTLLWVMVR